MGRAILIVLAAAFMTGWFQIDGLAAEQEALTEAVLADRGIEHLADAALRNLIVGKTLNFRSLVTEEFFEARYGTDGTRTVQNLSEESSSDGRTALSAPYLIHDAKVTTSYHGRVFEVRVYHVDGRFLAARSTDGGAVNWEIVSVE